jgi:hypothetical protein
MQILQNFLSFGELWILLGFAGFHTEQGYFSTEEYVTSSVLGQGVFPFVDFGDRRKLFFNPGSRSGYVQK